MRCRGLGVVVLLACGCLDVNPLFVEPTEGPDAGTGQATTTSLEPTSTPGPTSDTTTSPTDDTATTLVDETTDADPTSSDTTEAVDTENGMCGDGMPGPGEECDDGNQVDDDGCSNTCTLPSVCGDGEMEGLEQCDDGNAIDSDKCFDCKNAVCGDGVQHLGVEECDDLNNNEMDGCDNFCKSIKKLIFVTSIGYTGDLGGLATADSICKSWALDGGLPDGEYLAWLSDAQDWPAKRMKHHPGPYILPGPDEPVVALNWDDLTDGTLVSAIDRDVFGLAPPPTEDVGCSATGVMTNTDEFGEAIGIDEFSTCFDWNSAEGVTSWGSTAATNKQWTDDCADNPCGFFVPFICVQQ